jgi:hypothetical protein
LAYRRKRSSITADTAFIANRLSSTGALVLGFISFVIFYWLLPAWINHQLASLDGNQFRPVVAAIFEHKIHWLHRLGGILALICLIIAVYKVFIEVNLSKQGERNITFLSRLIHRLIS